MELFNNLANIIASLAKLSPNIALCLILTIFSGYGLHTLLLAANADDSKSEFYFIGSVLLFLAAILTLMMIRVLWYTKK